MTPAIRVERVGKQYRRGCGGTGQYRTLRESVAAAVGAPFRRLRGSAAPADETFWALKDISFEVRPGEVVGIIGRNGAGKSTLLKLLSRITEPTCGRMVYRGRMSSLLEIGTGFHQELTGRENIFLNGTILGMSRAEVSRKFDDIVAFAELAPFLETPVKRYSSGMYVRLAFAVAAHLDPEILVVDEVLAVGDAAFQRKCLNTMSQVGREGRTVLFVSHDMSAVNRLCERAILLDAGRVVDDGPCARVTAKYLRSECGTTARRDWPDTANAPGNEVVRLRSVNVCGDDGTVRESFDIRRPVGLRVTYEVDRPGHVLVPFFRLFNAQGACVFLAIDQEPAWRRRPKPRGTYTSTAWVPGNYLAEGAYVVGAALATWSPERRHFDIPDVVAFRVADTIEGDSARGDYAGNMPGVVRPALDWETAHTPA